jgi:beta-aspartyl-dipeptidase (metallo-type)
VSSIREYGFALEQLLPHFCSNAAKVLCLPKKGRVQEGADADLVGLDKDTLAVRHVIANGRVLVRGGEFCAEAQQDPTRQERAEMEHATR